MADRQVLDDEKALTVERVCEAIVPGSARVRPVVYVDALLARMDEGTNLTIKVLQNGKEADGRSYQRYDLRLASAYSLSDELPDFAAR